jgi:hypothetical protein
MSIFSSVSCPFCNKGELGIAFAHGGYNKVRLDCGECDKGIVTELRDVEFDELVDLIERCRISKESVGK